MAPPSPPTQVWVEDLHKLSKGVKQVSEFREWLSELHLHSELAQRAAFGPPGDGSDGSDADEPPVPVTFKLQYHCNFGQNMCLTGVAKTMVSWDVQEAVPLQWGDGDVWSAQVQLTSR
jgi:hypothetical protein